MAQRKLYQPIEGAVVPPSKVVAVEERIDNPVRYRVYNCKGIVGNAIRYSSNNTLITFISKDDKGKTIEGIQPEQLALIMKDYLLKQDNPNLKQIGALNDFLSAAQ